MRDVFEKFRDQVEVPRGQQGLALLHALPLHEAAPHAHEGAAGHSHHAGDGRWRGRSCVEA